MNIIERLATHCLRNFRRLFYSKKKYARIEGVKIGKNCFIGDYFWMSAEPYLIEIGDNCQVTGGVKMFTHGGGGAVRQIYP